MGIKAQQYSSWFESARLRAELTQQVVADRLGAMGVVRSQGWISRIETGKTDPTSKEAVLLAGIVGADPVEAMRVAGFLDEPPLSRIETKIDSVIRLLSKDES